MSRAAVFEAKNSAGEDVRPSPMPGSYNGLWRGAPAEWPEGLGVDLVYAPGVYFNACAGCAVQALGSKSRSSTESTSS